MMKIEDVRFKAWVKDERSLVKVISLCFEEEELKYRRSQELVDMGLIYRIVSFEDVELLPYTGFKDKNGDEIYEGDITTNNINTLLILWDGDYGKFRMLKTTHCGLDDCGDLDSTDLEIIGNCFENPELLEK